ncbi:MAG: hypothetical protein HXX17_03225 [Geobacteraceae bacterium]|nr:hypothetical protein [Geobacteraceae bacterium]
MNLGKLRIQIITLLSGAILTMSGCGGSSGGVVPVISPTASNECIACHATNSKSVSSTSGVKITEQWLLSAHNTAHGAGCMDCHTSAHFHDNVTTCRSCHATSHSNNGTSCNLCHGGGSKEVANCSSCHLNVHSIANMNKDSCTRCHGGDIPVDVAMKNPDFAGKCFGCHQNGSNFRRYTSVALKHFNNFTGSNYHQAMYVTASYQNSCTSCHEPHNPLLGLGKDERKAWAKSAHGDVKGVAWTTYDFKNPVHGSYYYCQRCHTATGYIKFTQTNDTRPTTTWATSGDLGREVLTCKACHASSNFASSVRTVKSFTTPYKANGGSDLIPDLGESNLCIPCHAGLSSQADILGISNSAISNTGFKNPHYMAAAGIMYMKAGFTSFTSATALTTGTNINVIPNMLNTYGLQYSLPLTGNVLATTGSDKSQIGYPLNGSVDSMYGGIPGGVTSAHRAIGTATARGRETWMRNPAVYGLWETKGPCVTCHVKADITHMPAVTTTTAAPFLPAGTAIPVKRSDSHSYLATTNDTGKQLCMPCHNDAGDFSAKLNTGDFADAIEEKLQEAKPYFLGGLAIITKLLDTRFSITFNNGTYPYFFEKTGGAAVTDWTRGGTLPAVQARRLMGACYNLKLLSADKGAFVHGRSYVQRLIFDSIDFLDNGRMDGPTNLQTASTIVLLGDPLLFPNTTADHWLYKANGVRK